MSPRFASVVAAGAILALAAACVAHAEGSAKKMPDRAVPEDRGAALDAGGASAGGPLFGGTACLPGTGMFYFSGPPESSDVLKISGEPGGRAEADVSEESGTAADAGVR